jgi:CheY-like chemotaxis protein
MPEQRLATSSETCDGAGEQPVSVRGRVLIAEDEPMIAWGLVDVVRRLGYKVCATVDTQEAAIEAAARLAPDIILLDYRLAGGDGLAAARRIRAAHDIPIIFCTAYVTGLRPEIPSIPRAQLIGKPVTPNSLQQALLRAATMK